MSQVAARRLGASREGPGPVALLLGGLGMILALVLLFAMYCLSGGDGDIRDADGQGRPRHFSSEAGARESAPASSFTSGGR